MMPNHNEFTKETFLKMASHLGLDPCGTQMQELYEQVAGMLLLTTSLHEIEMGDINPANIFSPHQE